MLGGWTTGSQASDESLYSSLRALLPDSEIVTAMTGELGALQDGITDVEDKIDDIESLKDCDVIIAAVGEHCADTGEAASKTNIRLSRNQERMMYELKKLHKPVIMVVFSGRPMEILPVLDCADAVVQAWFLGCESGRALADILLGNVNPSGRLSMSFPYTVGQVPVHYNMFNTGRPAGDKNERYLSRYLDCPNEPLFSFGYGLSYSEFKYSRFNVTVEDTCTEDTVAKTSVYVENISDRAGKETVQLYIRDMKAEVVRPLKEFKGFKQVNLAAGEGCEVTFDITKDMLSYWNNDGQFVFEPGMFEIMAGSSSVKYDSEEVYIG